MAAAVTAVRRTDAGSPGTAFEAALDAGGAVAARRLLVATGLRDELPDIPGLRDRWGRDVLHCPYCHGYEVGDRALGVLGGVPGAVRHALLVGQWSPDLTFFTNGSVLTEEDEHQLRARDIRMQDGRVAEQLVDEGGLYASLWRTHVAARAIATGKEIER